MDCHVRHALLFALRFAQWLKPLECQEKERYRRLLHQDEYHLQERKELNVSNFFNAELFKWIHILCSSFVLL